MSLSINFTHLPMSKTETTSQSYDDAIRELQHILTELQSGSLGIDELSVQLQRASDLLTFCQNKLVKTEEEVQAVLKRLGLDDAPSTDADTNEASSSR